MLSHINLKIFLPAVLLILIGSVSLSSVSPASFPYQFLYLGLAFIVFITSSFIDIRVWKAFVPFLFAFSIFLLLITDVLGVVGKGAVRWIEIGSFTLQASEVAKPVSILFTAWFISQSVTHSKFIFSTLFILPVLILVLIQPDLGSAIVIFAGFFGVIFLGGLPWKYIIGGLISFIISIPILWKFLADYQKDRVFTFINPALDPLGRGYNSIQAQIAIGSGGFFGRGLGQGTQSQLSFLPERHTDFIFAAIGEELGFLGVGLIILTFSFLLFTIVKLMKETDDLFIKSFLGGVFFCIFTQSFVNIGMNMGILPITGIPLPFVSSGGSALIAMSAMLGMVSSFGRELRSRA